MSAANCRTLHLTWISRPCSRSRWATTRQSVSGRLLATSKARLGRLLATTAWPWVLALALVWDFPQLHSLHVGCNAAAKRARTPGHARILSQARTQAASTRKTTSLHELRAHRVSLQSLVRPTHFDHDSEGFSFSFARDALHKTFYLWVYILICCHKIAFLCNQYTVQLCNVQCVVSK